MAGTKKNTYGSGNTDLTNLMEVVDMQRKGFEALSITNFATTTAPAIEAGSCVEINGSLYYFASEEAVDESGGPAWSSFSVDTVVYMMLVPSGSAITVQWTTTPPVWNTSLHGWYDSSNVNLYTHSLYKDASSLYTTKNKLWDDERFYVGDIKMFDGAGWIDNETQVGWYSCIAANAGQGCPNLVSSFIMGRTTGGSAGTGGSNTIVDHTHGCGNQSANHTHSHTHGNIASGNQSASHTHSYESLIRSVVTGNLNNVSSSAGKFSSNFKEARTSGAQSASHTHTTTIPAKASGTQSASHTHIIGSGSVPGSTDSRPKWYSVIYIRKCA